MCDGFEIRMKESDGAWHVYVPGMEHIGAATRGRTEEEVRSNIRLVMKMIAEEVE